MENQSRPGQLTSDAQAGNEQLQQALHTLENFIKALAVQAGESEAYGEELWSRIKASNGVLKEVAYYHDNAEIWGKYQVAGYSLTDILVWQVDHFKAYLDRHEAVNRWKPERLFLQSVDVLLQMEKDPYPYVKKLQSETGTDFVGKF